MKHGLPRILAALAIAGVMLTVCAIWGLRLAFGRTSEFRATAKAGQPIVEAIEKFQTDTGHYPGALADLAPRYLPTQPEVPDREQHRFRGWDYELRTNDQGASFSLRYYLGRGGVEYEAPNWIGNNEGSREVVIKGQKSRSAVQRTGTSRLVYDTNQTTSADGGRH